MSKILGNIYDRSIAMVLKIVETYFVTKNVSKSYIYVFFFYPKNNRTGSRKTSIIQELLVRKSCPTPRYVTFLIFGFWYILSFEWSDVSLQYLVTGQPPKFKACVWNFPVRETGSQCNLTCWYIVIIMELKRKLEYSCACTFWTS